MFILKHKITFLFVLVFCLQLSNIVFAEDVNSYKDIDEQIIRALVADGLIDSKLDDKGKEKEFEKIKEKDPHMIETMQINLLIKEIEEEEKEIWADINKTSGKAFALSPVAYWNTHRNGFDLGLNIYMFYKISLFEPKHPFEGVDFFLSLYCLYGFGNAKGDAKSSILGENLKYKIQYATTIDFGWRARINNKISYSITLFGIGYSLSKINITNNVDGGSFSGTYHGLIFHVGFEIRYNRFFTRVDLLVNNLKGQYIDGNGVLRTYSKSNNDGKKDDLTTSFNVLCGVGIYLF